ncbi:MAG: hypothetical protein JWR67_2781 [Mucilaginibacter sp.]|nr:hypothetical protein [Mucilaginibacter sp.]
MINNTRLQLAGFFIGTLLLSSIYACKNKSTENNNGEPVIYKGLYSYGPEVKSFKGCNNAHEFWVTDSSARLELQYTQLGFEKKDVPVYVEVEAKKVPSTKDGPDSGYDSTLIVTKLIKLTKDIPQGCN